jgi:hypothetical protein
VSVTPVRLGRLLLSRRSPTLWRRTVPIHTVYFFFYCPRSLAGAFYFYHRHRDAPGIFNLSLDPRPGTPAPTAPIIGILEIVGRYQNRYNFRPRVVIPRLTASARVIAVLVRVLQLQYFSQPAPSTSFQ